METYKGNSRRGHTKRDFYEFFTSQETQDKLLGEQFILSERVRDNRKRLKLSQEDMAEAIDCGIYTYRKIESADIHIEKDTYMELLRRQARYEINTYKKEGGLETVI